MKLNKEQKEAVRHRGGPLLIIAGAGTGKTTVITERIVHLIKSGLARPSEILALTFTEKASEEMQERVDVVMPYGYTDMWISTFHSFCDRVLRDEALAIGLSTGYSLLTKAETIQFVRENLYEFDLEYFRPVGNPTKFIDGLVTHFSRLQDEDIAPSEYLAWVKREARNSKSEADKLETQKYKELADAYEKYEELKAREGYMDFGDLIVKTLLLFRRRPNVLRQYQNRFRYILIDEFQDTNYAQFELSLLLAGNQANITVVADDDQSIYHWRGASISNVMQFKDKYPKAKTVVLTQNYRTYQEILDSAYRLIQFNNPNRLEVREGISKKLKSQRRGAGEIIFFHEARVEREAERVAREILRLVSLARGERREWRDFAILVRANAHADPFVAALKYHGIPYQFLGPDKLFLQPEVVELVSYLKVLTDQNDTTALYQVLSMEELQISSMDLSKLTTFARRKNKTLFEVFENYSEVGISEETEEILSKLKEVMGAQMKGIKNASAGKLLYDFLTEMEIMPRYIEPDTEERQRRTANIGLLFEKIKNYEAVHVGANVFGVVDWIELASEMGDSPRVAELDWSQENAVNVLTVHSSKGLEFPVVFLTNLVNLRFPSVSRRDQIPVPDEMLKEVLPTGDVHLQEERRLFYVGMTRARDRLYFTAADFYGENLARPKKLSPFIFEALGEDVEKNEQLSVNGEQLGLLDFKPSQKPKTKSQRHHLDYLSYSQIETFKMCPMHYKLRYILGVPTPPSGALALGSSIHSTLKTFYEEIKSGEKGTEKLLKNILKEKWIDDGYISKSHEEESYKKAEQMLGKFFKEDFDKNKIPVLLEQPFVVPLKKAGEKPLKIGGVIDRVDELSGGVIEIIDYKTGASPSGGQKEVDKNLQLSLYALAATRVNEPPLDKKPEKVKLTLYYLEEGVKFSTTRTAVQLNEAVDEVFRVRKEIEESDFACSGHPFCSSCEYKSFCRQNSL